MFDQTSEIISLQHKLMMSNRLNSNLNKEIGSLNARIIALEQLNEAQRLEIERLKGEKYGEPEEPTPKTSKKGKKTHALDEGDDDPTA